MTIERSNQDDAITLSLSGRLDTTTAPELQMTLIPVFDEGMPVVLDFAGLQYVSSAGLRVLLMGEKAAKAKGGSMALVNVSAEIMDVFNMTGFADILTIR